MDAKYIKRSLEKVLKQAAGEFPAVVLTGPRQSGKTTLLNHLFGKEYTYISLELPGIQLSASADPRSFIETYPPPVIYDEIQNAPILLPYIKEHIDNHRDRAGQFLLSGSKNILLLKDITETLAGRTAILQLFPLSQREISGTPFEPLPWERDKKHPNHSGFSQQELWRNLLQGGYPELIAKPGRNISLWHSSYVQTYLERDVRSLRQITDLTLFRNFLVVLAGRSSQLLSLSDIGRDLGIAVNTVKAWLSVLETTYQVVILRPYFVNVGKRLVKSPKVYFTDTGTLCHFAGITEPNHIATGPMGGAIMETAVIVEIFKTITNRGEVPRLFFWRTSHGREVDLIVDIGNQLIPIEIKLSATPRPSMGDGVRSFCKDYSAKAGKGYVVHTGDLILPLGGEVTAIPFTEI